MSLDRIAAKVHETAREKGFWDHEFLSYPNVPIGDEGKIENPSIIPEKLALIMGEAAEALDAYRDDDYSELAEELADIVIRVLDLSESLGFSMDTEVERKMDKNKERPYLHGRVR